MAINTYGTLKSAVASWLARSDLTTTIPDFIYLAESHFNATLFLHRFTTRNAAFAVTGQFTSLPSGFRRMKTVTHLYSSARYEVPYLSSEQLTQLDDGESTGGPLTGYTIVGSEIGVHPTPSSATLELIYWPTVTELSDSTTTSDLLTLYPLLYLYRSCLEGAIYMRDDSLQARAEAHYTRALADAVISDAANSLGTAPMIRAA